MKKLRQLLIVVLAFTMCVALSSCGEKELAESIKVGSLVGPTGMGLIDLMDDEKIDVELYQNPTDAVQKLISGDIDIACVPSNLGGVLYNKTQGNIQVLTTIVNGVLYIVENGESVKTINDLKGTTIYGSGKGGTPEYALQALLENAGLQIGKDVQVEWLDSHATVAQKVASTAGAIGLLPEPQVSAITMKNKNVKVALDLNSAWQDMTGQELPMGILIAKKNFVESRSDDLAVFLDEVFASIEDVQTASDEVVEKIVNAGIIGEAALAKAAIPNCSLIAYSGDDTKAAISAFYDKLFKLAPASIGGAMPEDDFYYGVTK